MIALAESETARRSEVVTWESAAWTVTGVAWVVSAWPGLLVSWDGVAIVPIVAITALAVFVTWQVTLGASWSNPSWWVASRTRRSARPPKSRRSLATAIATDGVLWAGSGIAWCAAARRYNWSEGFTGAPIQMGVGLALIMWAALSVLAARRISNSGDNTAVVTRRILGTGPMTVVGLVDQNDTASTTSS